MDRIFLYILALIIPLIATININATFSKYKKINNKKKLSGFEVARRILDENGLDNMYVVEVKGSLSDHYDPTQKVIRLSTDVFHGESIGALAVAAHECGHAIQDKEGYVFYKIRAFLCPVVNFATNLAYIVFIISILLEAVDYLTIAIVLIFLTLIFQCVTLPVEFDASKRAMNKLKEYEIVDDKESDGASKVLKAAAMTYVAAVLSSLFDLIRLILASASRED